MRMIISGKIRRSFFCFICVSVEETKTNANALFYVVVVVVIPVVTDGKKTQKEVYRWGNQEAWSLHRDVQEVGFQGSHTSMHHERN